MSRAIRRQQRTRQEGAGGDGRGGRLQPFGPRQPRQTRGTVPQRRRRIGVPGWLSEIWSELRKVTWPTRDETAYLTMVVIIVAICVGIVLGAIDMFFNWLIDQILLR